jgi:hypothetical protein
MQRKKMHDRQGSVGESRAEARLEADKPRSLAKNPAQTALCLEKDIF